MRQALQTKYDAMTAPLTALEKTMSMEQLKEIGHPAWARDYTAEHLRLYFIYGSTAHPHGQQTKELRNDTENV